VKTIQRQDEKIVREKAILVFLLGQRDIWSEEDRQKELIELGHTAGLTVVGLLVQRRSIPDSAFCVGKGKLEELQQLCEAQEADCIVFDCVLSPSQLFHLSKIFMQKILDKTMLILDIFAQRARSREGKLQVELAQATYLLPRLSGQGIQLSRQGGGSKSGGVGTRGPGETKLEMDRRRVRHRIQTIQRELKDVRRHRAVQQKNKLRNEIPLIAFVGYTNAGKSSLLNCLTEEQIYAADQLFATLDPTTRAFYLPSGQKALLTDTVGFIRDLPSQLLEAFQATLDELQYADLLLHVVDISNPNFENQLRIVDDILQELQLTEKPRLVVFNKVDRLQELPPLGRAFVQDTYCYISAKKGIGISELLQKIEQLLAPIVLYQVRLPLGKGNLLHLAYQMGHVACVRYTADAIFFDWSGPQDKWPQALQPYLDFDIME